MRSLEGPLSGRRTPLRQRETDITSPARGLSLHLDSNSCSAVGMASSDGVALRAWRRRQIQEISLSWVALDELTCSHYSALPNLLAPKPLSFLQPHSNLYIFARNCLKRSLSRRFNSRLLILDLGEPGCSTGFARSSVGTSRRDNLEVLGSSSMRADRYLSGSDPLRPTSQLSSRGPRFDEALGCQCGG